MNASQTHIDFSQAFEPPLSFSYSHPDLKNWLHCFSSHVNAKLLNNGFQYPEKFAKGYDALNGDNITKLYTSNAELLNLYDKENPNSVKGQNNIQKYFQNFFQMYKTENKKIQITFKITDRKKVDEAILDNGFYRIGILAENKPSFYYYGKFSTVLEFDANVWKFRTDASTNTDFEEYENAVSKTIPEREELLYPPFYDELLGDYVTQDNQLMVVGRSQSRLYVYFENTNEFGKY